MRFRSNTPKAGSVLLTVVAALIMVSVPSQRVWAQTEPAPDRGWNALADVLDVLTPSTNTENPPSGEDINRSIQQQIDRRQAEAALKAIEARQAELAKNTAPGTDVQLMFQKARALAELGRSAEAEAVYRDMTVRFPELPEPWNNLAILYISRNDLDQARLALEAAIMNNPRYTAAISNLADLQLLLSLRDYEQAAALGDRKARARAQALRQFLIEVNQP
jgi:Flp pilus assembly protein TadD